MAFIMHELVTNSPILHFNIQLAISDWFYRNFRVFPNWDLCYLL